jgi:Peptidase S24-like
MMKNRDEQKFRRLALANWLTLKGGMKNIARERNLNPSIRSQVSSILRGYNFGEVAARNMEMKLGIPEGWLDSLGDAEVSNAMHILDDESPSQCNDTKETTADSLTLTREVFCIPYFSVEELPVLYRNKRAYRSSKILTTLDQQSCLITDMRITLAYLNRHIPKSTNLKNLRVITSQENSTAPPFCTGDPMLIDIGINSVKTDGIYLFRLNGMDFIKRLLRTATCEIRVMHSDELYDSWVVTPNMDLKIFGEIIKIWRSETF